ncbi:MAG: hypothetical protein FD149_851 [Rhodospirillaceae bacterium]|nr:MAG: hypothetical protein FD149_851 [Rhodospirillaceae bacterium]
MTDAELRTMSELVSFLPAFRDYDSKFLPGTVGACVEILEQEYGLDEAMTVIRASVPTPLRETAYMIACEVAVADGPPRPEELRLLELLRDTLELDTLVTAAIERGTRARYASLPETQDPETQDTAALFET